VHHEVNIGIIFNFYVSLKNLNYAKVLQEVRLCQILVWL